MNNLRWKIVTVLAVFIIFFAVGPYPILAARYHLPSPAWLQEKQLKLGLDLKGGVHLVLRVQTEDALRLETDLESERLRDVLRTANIPANVVALNSTQFRVDGVPPAQDAAFRTAANEVQTNFERGSGSNGSYTFTMRPNIQVNLRGEAVVQARQTIERRVNELGVTEPQIAQQGANGDEILVQLPGVTDVEKAKSIIQSTGTLELKIVEQGPVPTREALLQNGQIPQGMDIVPGVSGGAPGEAAGTVYYLVRKVAAVTGRDLRSAPQVERRALLERALARATPPLHLTPMTRDAGVAAEWLSRFEGAGLDGVMAKRAEQTYQPDKRTMLKVKHQRTADCVVAGFRWHKNGPGTLIGSLLLGLYDGAGKLHHVGVTSSFTAAKRKELVAELSPLREGAAEEHPWREWAQWNGDQRMPGGSSRWNRGKDLSWEPLRIERVCEVAYDHLQGDRFRHATTFQRWRPDKPPAECRYDQLEETPAAELKQIFAGG